MDFIEIANPKLDVPPYVVPLLMEWRTECDDLISHNLAHRFSGSQFPGSHFPALSGLRQLSHRFDGHQQLGKCNYPDDIFAKLVLWIGGH